MKRPQQGRTVAVTLPASATYCGLQHDRSGQGRPEHVGNGRGNAGESVLLLDTEIIASSVPPYPRKCGVYFLIKDHELKYVGQSIDVEGRLREHRSRGFDRWHWIPCAAEELDSLERRYLDAFLPPWNSDPLTVTRRKALQPPVPVPMPPAAHPLDGVDPELWARCGQEFEEWEATHWTEGRVNRERMRRVRAMRMPGSRMEDFGTMPQVGDPWPETESDSFR